MTAALSADPARRGRVLLRVSAGRLSPARVHQIMAGADLDGLDAALGELRAGPPRKTPAGTTTQSWTGAT